MEDLPALRQLWATAQLAVHDLEKRFTDFHVLMSDKGEAAGAIGLHVARKQGWIHHEEFAHPEAEEELRPMVGERLMVAARNQGLHRLWTYETSPYYTHLGFHPATPEVLSKLPPEFGDSHEAQWTVLELKTETVEAMTMEKELQVIQEARRAEHQQLLKDARVLKWLTWMLALGFCGFAVWLVFRPLL